ncbi:MAG: hypothetical protein DRJ47_08710 [Thermoprotei archaeon]|nr:MAG: hypothetical protein DRJ47_08710 [Thermoprotei archaeon]
MGKCTGYKVLALISVLLMALPLLYSGLQSLDERYQLVYLNIQVLGSNGRPYPTLGSPCLTSQRKIVG